MLKWVTIYKHNSVYLGPKEFPCIPEEKTATPVEAEIVPELKTVQDTYMTPFWYGLVVIVVLTFIFRKQVSRYVIITNQIFCYASTQQ
jgi:hypothetical protein